MHQGTTDFGGITEVSPDDELFLVELDRNSGATNWAVTAGGIGDDEGGPVGVDSMGNIWQVGSTTGSFTENGMTHQAVSQRDTILIKWSSSGVAQDVIGFSSGSSEINLPADLLITQNDDVIVSGVFLGSMDAGNQNTLSDRGNGDAYIRQSPEIWFNLLGYQRRK